MNSEIIFSKLSIRDDYYQYCQLLKQLTKINPELISEDKFIAHLQDVLTNKYHHIIVAKINSKIVGSITVLIEPKFIHDLSYIAHIEDVVVDSEYRSHGLGRKLMNEAIKIAKLHDCYKIILDCHEDKVEFYKKNGFEKTNIQMSLYF